MRNLHKFVLAFVLFSLSACSAESVKRTTYETLQNIGEVQCQKDLSADCSNRESYESYKRITKENDAGDN